MYVYIYVFTYVYTCICTYPKSYRYVYTCICTYPKSYRGLRRGACSGLLQTEDGLSETLLEIKMNELSMTSLVIGVLKKMLAFLGGACLRSLSVRVPAAAVTRALGFVPMRASVPFGEEKEKFCLLHLALVYVHVHVHVHVYSTHSART